MQKEKEEMTTKKKGVDWRIVSTGIVCLTAYGIYAASQGIDGQLMSAILAIIALAIGVAIPNPIKK